ncbi:uncharacterized protein LOC135335437 [Halichondria panicea]|uniref:uncharacterized protein LOC135335437 n=1 Tax=Halichondria panicea TaxID=6063 RepID=UPI00312B6C2B
MATGKALKKLKNHPTHKTKPAQELEQLAIELITPAKIRERFAHLLQAEGILGELLEDDNDGEPLHTLEFEAQHQKIKHETSKACHLSVKISLQKLQITLPFVHTFAEKLKFEYGALHTAVVVGNVVIEWGREELVEPRIDPNFVSEFQANIGDLGEWHEMGGRFQAEMSLANRQGDTVKQLGIVFDAIDEKSKLIDKLVGVIVEYNRNKNYGVLNCNCQDFAREALAALGIKKPIEFTGKLQERFEQLKKGNRKVPTELKSHQNLDAYVEEHKNELGLQDLEYLQCLYFAEHLPKIEKSGNYETWVCGMSTCKSGELDKLIREHSLANSQTTPPIHPHNQRHPTGNQFLHRAEQSAANSQATSPIHPHNRRLSTGTRKTRTSEAIRDSTIAASAASAATNEGTRKQCPTPDCEFYGEEETFFYCSKCFEVKNTPKCDHCENFGNPECNGLCNGCFMEKTKSESLRKTSIQTYDSAIPHPLSTEAPPPDTKKCSECNSYFANEDYHGLCHGCLMFKTKTETEIAMSTHTVVPNQPIQSSPVYSKQNQGHRSRTPYAPLHEKCQNPGCKNIKTETGYCDICNYSSPLPPTKSTSTSYNTETETILQSRCFLCTGEKVTDRNEVCTYHTYQTQKLLEQMSIHDPPSQANTTTVAPQAHAYSSEVGREYSQTQQNIWIPQSESDRGYTNYRGVPQPRSNH